MPALSPEVRQAAKQAEQSFKDWAGQEGWEVLRNGWPDFLCVDKGGRVICVEAKSGNGSLTRAQREVMGILASMGLRCYTWSEAVEEGVTSHTPPRPKGTLAPFRERRTGLAGGNGQATEEDLGPPQTFTKPLLGLPRRLWEVSGLDTSPS